MIREGRLKKNYNETVSKFVSSFDFDKNIFKYEIEINMAYAKMLNKIGILNDEELNLVLNALEEIRKEGLKVIHELEDVHLYIEKRLNEKIGSISEKIHTGRSRNDLIATNLRMLVRENLIDVFINLEDLITEMKNLSEKNFNTIMPGYTHLQHAQVITLSHYFIAKIQSLYRCLERIVDCLKRVNLCPLGSAALAGSSFNIDRKFLAKELRFNDILDNTLDATSSRDFILEAMNCYNLIGVELSRMIEEFIIFSTYEFNILELGDEISSTSSIMPQKKNPDVLELMRAKLNRLFSNYFTCINILKDKPYGYNRDFQEINPIYLESYKILIEILTLTKIVLKNVTFNKKRMQELCEHNFLLATDLAEFLVKKGLTFRKAHLLVGRLVRRCIEKNIRQKDINLNLIEEISKELNIELPKISENELKEVLDPVKSLHRKETYGSPRYDREVLEKIMRKLNKLRFLLMNDYYYVSRKLEREL